MHWFVLNVFFFVSGCTTVGCRISPGTLWTKTTLNEPGKGKRTSCYHSDFSRLTLFELLSICFRFVFDLFSICFRSVFDLFSICFRFVFVRTRLRQAKALFLFPETNGGDDDTVIRAVHAQQVYGRWEATLLFNTLALFIQYRDTHWKLFYFSGTTQPQVSRVWSFPSFDPWFLFYVFKYCI